MTSRIKDRITEVTAALVITGVVSFCTGYFGVLRGQATAEAKMQEQDRRITKLEADYGDLARTLNDGFSRLREEVSANRADTAYIRGKLEGK